jgi:uncharacterized protein YjdB
VNDFLSEMLFAKRWKGPKAWFTVLAMLVSLFPVSPAVVEAQEARPVSSVRIAAYTGVAAGAPPLADPAALRSGDTFAAWVTVENALNLQGADLQLEFNPNVLQVKYVRDHLGRNVPLLVPGPINQLVADRGTVNNQAGSVSYGASNEEAADYTGVTALLKIGFTVIGEGAAFVRFAPGSPQLTDGVPEIIDLTNIPVTPLEFLVAVAEAAAEAAVAAAEVAPLVTQADVDAAQGLHDTAFTLVNDLPAGTAKDALLARLTAVQVAINTAQDALDLAAAVAVATAAVDAAEDAPLGTQAEVNAAQGLHDTAFTLVNALPAGADRDDLLDRLTDVQDDIDAAQAVLDALAAATAVATAAVEAAEAAPLTTQAEVYATQVLHNDALALVNALPDGAVKDGLLDRLAAVQDDIDTFIPVDGVTVAPDTATINAGATQQLSATVTPADATNRAVAWTSSDATVATVVYATGLVTGIRAGSATITATTVDGGFTDTSVITVVVPALPAGDTPAPPAPPAPPAAQAAPPTVVEKPIVAGQTTEVELENVVKVTVTAGAITGEAPKIAAQVMPGAEAAPIMAAAIGVGLTVASDVVVLTMTGGEFTAPVQLTLNFDAAKVAAGQVPSVFVYNERTGRWIFLGGQVGVGTITVTLDRFSKFAVFATRPMPTLADIADHWGRGSIRTLAGMGVVSGFPDGNFKPGAGVTRAEFVSMLTRALGLPAKPEAAARFTDADRWARGGIGAAAEAGLIAGYADGTFGGSRRITRAEMAVILQRVIRKGLVPVALTAGTDFADAGTFPAWAAEGIRMASTAGLVRGFQDRTFRPGSTTTRAEAAAMLYRLVAER